MSILIFSLSSNLVIFQKADQKVDSIILPLNVLQTKVGVAFAQTEDDEDNEDEDEVEEETEEDTEDEVEDEAEEETEEETEEEEEEIEIEVEIEDGIAKVEAEFDDQKFEFELETTDVDVIIEEIVARTGLTREQVEAAIEIEEEIEEENEAEEEGAEEQEEEEESEEESEREAKRAEKVEEREMKAMQKSEEIIQRLEQKIEQLEQRLQSLLSKLETGEYFGPTLGGDPVTKSYTLSFEGSATSKDGSIINDVSGEIFLETLVTRNDVAKLRVTGGDILVGETFYDLAFGKARVTSSGPSGEKDSMVLIAQIMDDEENSSTLKIFLNSAVPLEGEFGVEPAQVDIKMPQSKIAGQWFLSASGQLSVI